MQRKSPHSNHTRTLVAFAALLFVSTLSSNCVAQKDTVFLNSGTPVRGEIKNMDAEQLTVDARTINVRDVKKINFNNEPRELRRAKESIESNQFEDAWSDIQKIDQPPRDEMILQEFEYAKAFVMGKLALSGGQVTTREAGTAIRNFVNTYPNSFRLYPIIDLYGQLLVNINRLDLAQVEFEKLAASNWPRYQLKGMFDLAQAQLLMENYDKAKGNFDKLQRHELNTPTAQQYKLMAKCQLAKIDAFQGNVDNAIQAIETMIKSESADNKQLFALCYNALGICNLEKKELRGAAIAFLHTDLLFSTESDAHSEALYHLAKIWPQLEETDRANRARQTLNRSYANSFWKQKMDNAN